MFFPKLSQISTQRVITLADHHTIQDAASLMDQQSLRDVVITGETGLRMVTARELIAFRLQDIDFSTALSDVNLQTINSIDQNATVIDGLTALKDGSFEYLCLLDNAKNLMGIVSYSDMAAHLDPHYLSEFKRIDDLVHLTEFISVEANATLKSVLILMRELQQTSALIKSVNGEHVGIVTQKDITHAIAQQAPVDSPVQAIMISPLITIDGETSLQQALSFSRERKLKRLVVTHQGKVIGLLHQKDLVALVYEKWRNLLDEQQRHLQAERELFKNGPVLLFIWQPEGHWPVKFVSDNVKDILGYSPEELMQDGFEFGQMLHPDDLEKTITDLEQALRNKAEFIKQSYRVLDKHRQVHWVYDYTRPSYDEQGKVTTVFGYLLDQTEQIQAQICAEQAQAKLELALDASETGLWVWDMQTNRISWSDQAFIQLGYAPQAFEVTLASFQAKLHPDDTKKMFETIQQQMLEHKGFNVEFRFENAQGGWTWLQGRGKVTKNNAQGQPIEMMGVHLDISATKKTEFALKEQTELYLNLVEKHPFFINRFLPDTTTIYCNQTMASFFGATPDRMVGMRWADSLPSPSKEAALEALLRCTPEHSMSVNVNQVQDGQGRLRDIKWTTQAFFDEFGQVKFYQSVGQDITEQLALETKLKHTKKQAETANQAKSEFLANMSHEIRTPMNGIIGLSELAMKQDDVEILHEQLDKIYHSGRLLLGIINDILDFSKIEAGKLEIDPQPFFVCKLIDNLGSLFAMSLAQKPVQFHVNSDDLNHQAFVADSMRLRQVLLNLLGNAIKFTHQGEVRLNLADYIDNNYQAWLQFEVIDTGIGMSDHQQQKLFQAFSQADTSITRKHGGTGLGLVISQRLIELMGGDAIEVESKLGQGSCFRFRLPVALASEEQKSKLKQQDNVIQAQDKLTGHVLLVEDNEINQEVANNQLQDLGLQVTLAENGQLALDLIKQHHFDLVLMDIQMPIMDGYQATRAIREFDQDTPIIALTAAAMIEDKKKALAAGMNGHLSKPINLEELRLLLSNYLLSINTALIKPPQPIAHPIPPHGLLINRQKGLAQLSGNQVLYQKLMAKLATQLAEDYAGLPDDLNSLLVTEQPMPAQWQTLQSLNHALKGVTGNLAVDGLYELSKALDGLLKQQQKPSPDQVNQFTAVFDATLAALIADSSKNMFVNQSGSDAQYQADYSQLQILLKRIKNSEYIDESELAKFSSIVPSKYHQAWLNCQAKLDDFEFEQAAALVQQLMNDLQS